MTGMPSKAELEARTDQALAMTQTARLVSPLRPVLQPCIGRCAEYIAAEFPDSRTAGRVLAAIAVVTSNINGDTSPMSVDEVLAFLMYVGERLAGEGGPR